MNLQNYMYGAVTRPLIKGFCITRMWTFDVEESMSIDAGVESPFRELRKTIFLFNRWAGGPCSFPGVYTCIRTIYTALQYQSKILCFCWTCFIERFGLLDAWMHHHQLPGSIVRCWAKTLSTCGTFMVSRQWFLLTSWGCFHGVFLYSMPHGCPFQIPSSPPAGGFLLIWLCLRVKVLPLILVQFCWSSHS